MTLQENKLREAREERDHLSAKVIRLQQQLGQEEAKVKALHIVLLKTLAYIPNEGDEDMDLIETIRDMLKA